jgi:hypothetical protein
LQADDVRLFGNSVAPGRGDFFMAHLPGMSSPANFQQSSGFAFLHSERRERDDAVQALRGPFGQHGRAERLWYCPCFEILDGSYSSLALSGRDGRAPLN